MDKFFHVHAAIKEWLVPVAVLSLIAVGIALGGGYSERLTFADQTALTSAWMTPVINTSTNYTLTAADRVLLNNPGTGVITNFLPSAVGLSGKDFVLKNTLSTGSFVLKAFGSETIDGGNPQAMAVPYGWLRVVSDGTTRNIFSKKAAGGP